MGRAFRYLLVVGGAIVCILLFLLISASDNASLLGNQYEWLLGLNALASITLLGSVAFLLHRLFQDYRHGKFGSRLMVRLVLLFGLIGILPGAMIYGVSVNFVSHSIKTWFDVKVDAALDAGLKLSQSALDNSLEELDARAHGMALELSDLPDSALARQLARSRNSEFNFEAVVFTSNLRVLASRGGELSALIPDIPTNVLKTARLSRSYHAIEGGADDPTVVVDGKGGRTVRQHWTPLRLRVVVSVPTSNTDLSLQSDERFLQLTQTVPASLDERAKAVSDSIREYRERSIGRDGLVRMYLFALTLTLMLAIFGAVAGGFVIANHLARPLLLLAEGTQAVAAGNLSPRPIVGTNDELGILTQSFNVMTRQLNDAQIQVEHNRAELESAKAYLESVLANMSAGVMVLDHHFALVTCNESVERILHVSLEDRIGEVLAGIPGLALFSTAITRAFSEQSAQTAADHDETNHQHWQKQIEVPRHGAAPLPSAPGAATDADNTATLLARGSRLPVRGELGYVVVFDDISDVISGQRSIAWGEVARRLAHEIKNPLTPIQLAAERLQMKLSDKLDSTSAALLERSTGTIVSQVGAMKRMVDDFRNYARIPPAVLHPLDLNELIDEVLHLYLGHGDEQCFHAQLADGLPRVLGDATQMRQVIHNLLQNAQDAAVDYHGSHELARVEVVTDQISYIDADGHAQTAVSMSITDNGPGFSSKIMSRAFEPYITTKPKGTGLGLAMVKKIIDEHGGRIDIQNRQETNGAKVSILLLKLAPVEHKST